MALVNGHLLNPGNCQIVMHPTEQEFRKVVYNCPNFQDAELSLKHLLDDPREFLEGTVRFEILDHEGNSMSGGTYSALTRLKGEELAFQRLLDVFGYNEATRQPFLKTVVVYSLVGIIRVIYHLFFAFEYCFAFGILLGIPLSLLFAAYYWIVGLFHGY